MAALSYGQYIHGTLHPSRALWSGSKASYPVVKQQPANNEAQLPFKTLRPTYSNQVARLYEEITGNRVIKLDYPGGNKRDVCRLYLESGESVISCQRATALHQELEERVLHHLANHTPNVPKLLHANSLVFFQEDCGTQRLSQVADTANTEQLADTLDKALNSLIEIQHVASDNGLDYHVPLIGCEKEWVERLIGMPFSLGKLLDLPCTRPDVTVIRDSLTPVRPRFIKWDTRLGNALTSSTRGITWIDWEHSGARNRLDDLVILLCDEGTPDNPDVENWLLKKYLPLFADGRNLSDALTYCRLFGVLHMTARLLLILSRKKHKNQWWSKQFVLEGDYISMTKEHALCLSNRATRWAKAEPLVQPWSEWFEQITQHIENDTDKT